MKLCKTCHLDADRRCRECGTVYEDPDAPSSVDSRAVYDRVRAEFPNGGEEARDAFWSYLNEARIAELRRARAGTTAGVLRQLMDPPPSSFERPPVECYVRVTVERYGYTFEPALEYRDGDSFPHLCLELERHARRPVHRNYMDAAELVSSRFEPASAQLTALELELPDPMKIARAIGAELAAAWPGRAYFVEVWQEGKRGFAQVFQPFGVPRNR